MVGVVFLDINETSGTASQHCSGHVKLWDEWVYGVLLGEELTL